MAGLDLAPPLFLELPGRLKNECDLIVELSILPMSGKVFVQLLKHSEDQDKGKGANHRSRGLKSELLGTKMLSDVLTFGEKERQVRTEIIRK